jgi:hypothetical protein
MQDSLFVAKETATYFGEPILPELKPAISF